MGGELSAPEEGRWERIKQAGSLADKELRALFDQIDLNGDGFIDEEEALKAVHMFGMQASHEEVKQMMNMADLDRNAKIDFMEFCYFMRNANFWLSQSVPGRTRFLAMTWKTEGRNAFLTLFAGGTAGAVSRTTVAPFERLKILFQTQGHPPMYTSVSQALTKIWREEGLRGYFKGNGTNAVRIFPTSAIQFFSFPEYKRVLYGERDVSPGERLVAGACAGMTALVICYPLEFVRARLTVQTGGGEAYRGIYDGLRKTVRKDGFMGMYRGLWPSMLGVVPYVGIDFAVYGTLKQYVPKQPDGSVRRSDTLAIGAVAGTVAQTVAYPLDLIRRRMQVQGFGGGGLADVHYKSMRDAFSKTYAAEGVRGLYRGLWPNYLKVSACMSVDIVGKGPIYSFNETSFFDVVPAVAVQFLVFEEIRTALGLKKGFG